MKTPIEKWQNSRIKKCTTKATYRKDYPASLEMQIKIMRSHSLPAKWANTKCNYNTRCWRDASVVLCVGTAPWETIWTYASWVKKMFIHTDLMIELLGDYSMEITENTKKRPSRYSEDPSIIHNNVKLEAIQTRWGNVPLTDSNSQKRSTSHRGSSQTTILC